MEQNINQKIDQAAELLKVIAHPIRMRIVLLLNEQPSINVSTLQRDLKIDQSLLSHHLIKMKDKGLLGSTRQGAETHYFLSDSAFSQAVGLLLTRDDT